MFCAVSAHSRQDRGVRCSERRPQVGLNSRGTGQSRCRARPRPTRPTHGGDARRARARCPPRDAPLFSWPRCPRLGDSDCREPRTAHVACASGRARRLLLPLAGAIDASRPQLSNHVRVWGARASSCPSILQLKSVVGCCALIF